MEKFNKYKKEDNKKHWYDGWFYEKFVAPNQCELFKIISNFIPEESSVIDIGCGTGKFPFYLSGRCKYVMGVDFSQRNIKQAEKIKEKLNILNVDLIHGNAENIEMLTNKKYDFAVMTYVIHEMPSEERMNILTNIRKFADNIIIADYNAPQRKNITGYFNYLIEFAAGRNHFRNFRSYIDDGGLDNYFNKLNINITKTMLLNSGNTKINISNLL
jgi:SAM-dependent methyltransferase